MSISEPRRSEQFGRRVRSRPLTPVECAFYRPLVSQLVARRHALGLSQLALEQKLGVSDGQIAKWERGVRLPSSFFLCAWAQTLGLQITTTPSIGAEPWSST